MQKCYGFGQQFLCLAALLVTRFAGWIELLKMVTLPTTARLEAPWRHRGGTLMNGVAGTGAAVEFTPEYRKP